MERLDAVQGLRAIAAWLVVIAHGAIWAGGYGSVVLPARTYEMLGALGVLMFFTVSGFIMVFISRTSFGRPGAAPAFLRRRLIRIVPLYWLMTLLAAAILVRSGDPPSPAHLVQSLLFVPHDAGGPLMRPVLGVGWTLNYEMFFYALFAAALLLRRGLRLLCAALVGLLALGQLLNPVWRYRDPSGVLAAWTDPLLLPFLCGVGLAVLFHARPGWRIARPFAFLALGTLAVLLFQQAAIAEGSYPAPWRIAVLLLGALLAAPAILARNTTRVPRWLVFSGDASYSLYLIHPLLFGVADRLGGRMIAQASPLLGILYFCMLSTVAGICLHLFVERPLTRWFARPRRGTMPSPHLAPHGLPRNTG